MSGQPYIAVRIEGTDVTNRLLRVVLDEDEMRSDALEFSMYDTDPVYMDTLTEGMQVLCGVSSTATAAPIESPKRNLISRITAASLTAAQRPASRTGARCRRKATSASS